MDETDSVRVKPVPEDSNFLPAYTADAINIDGTTFNLLCLLYHQRYHFVDSIRDVYLPFLTQMDVIMPCVKIWRRTHEILKRPPGV